MDYYHDIITEKSWQKLQELKRNHKFILIGGWAVYLYSRMLKSKDIDLICDYEELQKLKDQYELTKNDRLKKYEIHAGEFDIDIYTPFFSDIGIPVEDLNMMTTTLEGFTVPIIEVLLILKQNAYQNRAHSIKGEKDRIDIIGLVSGGLDFKKYKQLLMRYKKTEYQQNLKKIVQETRQVPELNLGEHAFANFKKKFLKTC